MIPSVSYAREGRIDGPALGRRGQPGNGGQLANDHANVDQSGDVLHFTARTLEDLLERHGFGAIEVEKQFSNIRYLLARQRGLLLQLAFAVAYAASRVLARPNKLVALF